MRTIPNGYPSCEKDRKQLTIPVGKNESGFLCEDFANVFNMLISGTTGSGKTYFVAGLLSSLIEMYSPDDVQFLIFDSKGIEYTEFGKSPFVLMPVITDNNSLYDIIKALRHKAKQRLKMREEINREPHIIVVMDDCYAASQAVPNVYNEITELFQISRLTKIHFWFVTSLPVQDVFPRELLNNIATRVAFFTSTKAFSKQIIDRDGAERLKLPGEMIFKQYSEYWQFKSIRYDENALQTIINYSVDLYQNYTDQIVLTTPEEIEQYDEYFEEAGRLVIEKNNASIGYLQRVFRIGFNRTARIMDQLESAGVVGPEDGTRPRRVLMTIDQFEEFMSV